VPIFAEAIEYLNEGAIPGGTNRNWDSYGHKLKLKDEEQKNILCDPQTSGGLLISVDENYSEEVEALLKGEKLISHSFGYLTDKDVELIKVIL